MPSAAAGSTCTSSPRIRRGHRIEELPVEDIPVQRHRQRVYRAAMLGEQGVPHKYGGARHKLEIDRCIATELVRCRPWHRRQTARQCNGRLRYPVATWPACITSCGTKIIRTCRAACSPDWAAYMWSTTKARDRHSTRALSAETAALIKPGMSAGSMYFLQGCGLRQSPGQTRVFQWERNFHSIPGLQIQAHSTDCERPTNPVLGGEPGHLVCKKS